MHKCRVSDLVCRLLSLQGTALALGLLAMLLRSAAELLLARLLPGSMPAAVRV